MVSVFKSIIDNDKVVYDIDTNISYTSLLFGNLSKVVYAFEPSESTFALLKENVAHSDLQNIHLNNFGLGESCYESEHTFDIPASASRERQAQFDLSNSFFN